MKLAFFIVVAVLAAYKGWCPRGHRPPCPDPVGKVLLGGTITGAIAGFAYYFLFIGKRALECYDLIAVILIAFLFAVFIQTLFFAKREA